MNTPLLLDPAAVVADLVAEPAALPSTVPFPSPDVSPSPAPVLLDKRPFDPAKFKARADGTPLVSKQGFYMPLGFARPKAYATPPALPVTEPTSAPPAQDPAPGAASVPPRAAESAWGASDRASAAGAPSPEAGQAAGIPGTPPPVAAGADNSEEAAEVGTRALYFTVGILIGSPEEATLSAAEHANFHKAAAAYIRSTGWKGTPLTCLVLILCAYLLKVFQKPKASEVVRGWLADFRKKKPSEPVPVRASAPAAGPARNAPVSIVPTFSERSAA